jgi:hypothetical protein
MRQDLYSLKLKQAGNDSPLEISKSLSVHQQVDLRIGVRA